MAPKHHPTPLSGGDRTALAKELTKARAMTGILGARANEAPRCKLGIPAASGLQSRRMLKNY
jgi:hypothetical protein